MEERIYEYWREPTEHEIKFGEGARHYIELPWSHCRNKKGTGPKKFLWINGLLYHKC